MRLEWIEDLLAVHDTGSLRAAADVRYLTASAFTRRIKAVEEAIGCELFDRSNKPLTLRPHVKELVPVMREAATNLRNIQHELGGVDNRQHRTRLICQHTLSVSWAPKVARVLSKNGENLRIRSGTKDECSFSVLKNDADIALVYDEPNQVLDEKEDLFHRIHFGNEEFLPVAALRQNKNLVEAIEQKRIPLITYPRNIFLGEVLEKALSKRLQKSLNYASVAEAGLGPAVLEFVREGLGVGWLPSSMIQKEIEEGELVAITEHLPSFYLNIVALKSKKDQRKFKLHSWETIAANFDVN